MTTVIDTAAGFPSATAIRNAGHAGIIAYVSPSRPGTNFPGKPITKAIADQYRAAGVEVAAVWQYGKPGSSAAPSDWTTGYDGGRRMARQALANARAAGMPGWCPIYFAVDEDITLDQWNASGSRFFKGCCDEIGQAWVGIYGHSRVVEWAVEDGVVDPRWLWVTRAWSDDDGRGYAALYQRVIDTASTPGPKVGGITVDVNDVYARDWGQWSIDRTPSTSTPPATGGTTVIDPGITLKMLSGNNNGRRSTTRNAAVHTQQASSTARKLAAYCQPGNSEVSYNVVVDDIDTILVVDWEKAPWSAVAANDSAFHLCFAGSFAEWSTDRWLSKDASDGLNEDAMLWRGARLMAYVCQRFNIPAEWVGALTPNASNWPSKAGICGHVSFGARGGGHTDPGIHYPAAEFIRRIKTFLAPPPNLIEAEARIAAEWIGKRHAVPGIPGETVLYRDGKKIGAFVEYDAAHIYWRLGAGEAYAVPHGGIFEAWAERGWERGECGMPAQRHKVFSWGSNQLFEGGVLFVPTGGPSRGYLVHGEIGKRYAAMGWETGPLGLPTSDEQKVEGTDNIVQYFEHGKLTYSPSGVIVDLVKAGE